MPQPLSPVSDFLNNIPIGLHFLILLGVGVNSYFLRSLDGRARRFERQLAAVIQKIGGIKVNGGDE